MRLLEMVEPQTVAEAVRALRGTGAVPMAGATDLIPALRKGEIHPRVLVNVKHIPELAGVRTGRGGIRIGAATRIADLLASATLAEAAPLLVQVARDFGSTQIRNLATIGGNVCNAAPSADFALPLLVLEARAEIRGADGLREIEFNDFFRGVNRTVLRRGELLTALIIPRRTARTGYAHEKLTVRRAMDLATAAVAAVIQLKTDGRTCSKVRLALGAVAPTPLRARNAEALLEGKPLTPALIHEAAAAAKRDAKPITDLRASAEYRREMVGVLTERAVKHALQQVKQEGR